MTTMSNRVQSLPLAKKLLVLLFFAGLSVLSFLGLFPLLSAMSAGETVPGVVDDIYRSTIFYDVRYSFLISGKAHSSWQTLFFVSGLSKGENIAIAYNENTGTSYPKDLVAFNGAIWMLLTICSLWILGWAIYRIFVVQRR